MQMLQHRGHTLTWEEDSPGEHTFIFLHGYSASRQSTEPLMSYYKPLGRCVSLDLPGHGLAQTPADYSILTQDLLLDLETRAIQRICGDRPATLIGHSTGGLVALAVASRLPNVKRVVSIDSVIWGPLTGLLGFAHWLLRNRMYTVFWALWAYTQISPMTMMSGVGFYVHDLNAHWQNPLTWGACRSTHALYRQQDLKKLAILLQFLEKCDIRPLLGDLKIPVLAITGANDPVVPPIQAHWLGEHLPNAQLLVYDKTGHVPHWENETACNRAILDWLEKHPA